MNINKYYTFAEKVQGFNHRIRNLPCQDACATRKNKEQNLVVIAVADGHGSEPLSQYGSEIAVNIASEFIFEFTKNISEVKINDTYLLEKLYSLKNKIYSGINSNVKNKTINHSKPYILEYSGYKKIIDETNITEDSLNEYEIVNLFMSHLTQLEKSIVFNWNNKVEEKYQKLVRDCPDKLIELGINLKDSKENYFHLFGTTLLAAAVKDNYWFAIQIGDGTCIALFDEDNENIELKTINHPIPDDERCEGSITTSICTPESHLEFRHCFGTKLPKAILVGTDGIENSFPSKNREQELENLRNHYSNLIQKIINNIKSDLLVKDLLVKELNDLTDADEGYGDDSTIAGLISKAWIEKPSLSPKIPFKVLRRNDNKNKEQSINNSTIVTQNSPIKAYEKSAIIQNDNNDPKQPKVYSTPSITEYSIKSSELNNIATTDKVSNLLLTEKIPVIPNIQKTEYNKPINKETILKEQIPIKTKESPLQTFESVDASHNNNSNDNNNLEEIKENIFEAIKNKRDEKTILALAKNNSSNLNKKYDEKGYTPFILAVTKNYSISVLEALLNNGADINSLDDNGYTALMYASISSPKEIVNYLLDKGAKANIKNNSLDTALHYLITRDFCDLNLINKMISAGADINAQNNRGETILHNLVFNGKEELLVNFLSLNDLNVNAVNISNRTILSYVLDKALNDNSKTRDSKKWGRISSLLIITYNAKLSSNEVDNKLLIDYIKDNYIQAIDNLIKLGIDINAIDSETGLSALQTAIKLERKEISKSLSEAGAKKDNLSEEDLDYLKKA